MSKFTVPTITPEQREMCEAAFQKGAGYAQVYSIQKNGHHALKVSEITKAAALRYADGTDYAVFFRSKVRGQRRYEWVRVK